ncbi:MAG: hypothetical protein ACR2K2_03715 [Mycobacteriales bacterium]
MPPRLPVLHRVGLLLSTAIVLAACSGGAGNDASAPSNSASAPDADGGTNTTGGTGRKQKSPPPQEQPAEPLAAVRLPISFVEGGKLDIAVTSFDVAGDLLRLAVQFTATLPLEVEDVAVAAVLKGKDSPAAGISPELIDPVNLKAYEVVAGGTNPGTSLDLVDGGSRTLVFYYAAPQDDVATFDIMFSSGGATLTDVPVKP